MYSSPLLPLVASPEFRYSNPLEPQVDEPDCIYKTPLFPLDDVPELRTIRPLAPALPEFGVLRYRDPLDVAVDAPLDIDTSPPATDKVA